jgi:hypothetical protein
MKSGIFFEYLIEIFYFSESSHDRNDFQKDDNMNFANITGP